MGIDVMLVEDSGILVNDIQETLESEDVDISWIHSSGEDALEQLKDVQPDLVLMDIKLDGDIDGVETTNRIRNQFDIPVVYLTAYSNEKYMERVRNSDALAFLVKPLEKVDLRRIVDWMNDGGSEPVPSLKRGEFLKESLAS